jgi:hypothetical protein
MAADRYRNELAARHIHMLSSAALGITNFVTSFSGARYFWPWRSVSNSEVSC